MSKWTKCGENLVRWNGGTIYLRAKVAGKIIRKSLETEDLRIAKIKRQEELEALQRAAAVGKSGGAVVKTLGDALETVAARLLGQAHLEEATQSYYAEIVKTLRLSLPLAVAAKSWSAAEAAAWWKLIVGKYSGQRANNALGVVKRVGKFLVEAGVRVDDPTIGLKRVKNAKRNADFPSAETVAAIVENIRVQRKSHSEEAANYVAFLAFSGCRVSQAAALEWRHVGEEWLTFPAGVRGTKGAETRRLPISPPLREVLQRIRVARGGLTDGLVFQMSKPREALTNACRRLNITHLRIHDLRHFFASHALQSGIDVPTVSRWLGHKDGGVLVLKTYGHMRDDHSLASAAKFLAAPVSVPAAVPAEPVKPVEPVP